MQNPPVLNLPIPDEAELDNAELETRVQVPRLLVIDDDRATLTYVAEVLEASKYLVETIEGGKSVWEQLTRMAPHHLPNMIICDWTMPELTGVDICRRLKATPEFQYVYFILLTARTEIQDRVKGLDAGADEFITKPVDPDELRARVRAGLRLQQLTQALAQANRQLQARNELLESLSLTDQLTGVLNRRALDQALPHLLEQVGPRFSEARYRYLCLMILDVDHFKQVNDTYGHYAGDCVLQAVAQRLQARLRPSSLLYRYGGEEFICITPGLNHQRSYRYAEYLRSVIANDPIAISPKRAIPITISVGGTVVTDLQSVEALTAINQADQALYQAKQSGRNCVYMTPP
ncbi:MAG: diguanylate cyclase [Cyanobacteriota bacterium]|nr:diguanylate cyclase [Cyanobacteriota bacterium]